MAVKRNLKKYLLTEWSNLQNYARFNNRDYKINDLMRMAKSLRDLAYKGKFQLNLHEKGDILKKHRIDDQETLTLVYQILWSWTSNRVRPLCTATAKNVNQALKQNPELGKNKKFVKLSMSIKKRTYSAPMTPLSKEGMVFTLARQLGELLQQQKFVDSFGYFDSVPKDKNLHRVLLEGLGKLLREMNMLIKDVKQLPDDINYIMDS